MSHYIVPSRPLKGKRSKRKKQPLSKRCFFRCSCVGSSVVTEIALDLSADKQADRRAENRNQIRPHQPSGAAALPADCCANIDRDQQHQRFEHKSVFGNENRQFEDLTV